MNAIHIVPDVGIDCKPIDAALAYMRRGVPVFPVNLKKTPLTLHGFKDASLDETQVCAWWRDYPDAGISLPTGAVSGVDVIDIDPRHGGSYLALASRNALPETYTVATGGGGMHLYFQHREGVKCRTNVLPGVDVRSDGGYVVAPPSCHESGNRYSVANDAPLAEMPDWLYDLLTGSSVRPVPQGTWLERAVAKAVAGEGRNDTGSWLACQLRDSSMTRAEAIPVMEQYAEQVTGLRDEPYTYEEAYRTLESAFSRPPREPATRQAVVLPPLTDASLTDVGNADRFAAQYGDRLKHVTGWGWVAYDGTRWVRGAEKQAQEMAKACLREMVTQAQGTALERDVLSHVHASMSAYRIKSMLVLASSDPRMSASVDDFDTKPHLLNVANGTVDLQTGELRDHSPADHITQVCPVDYDPNAEAPRFQSFLTQVFPGDAETVAYLQRFIGYTATGETREEKWLYLSGTGSNGKGVLIRALAHVLGDYATAMAADVLTRSKFHDGGERTTPAYDTLPGKRFVYAQEPEGDALDEGKLKQLVSPDRMYVNPKNLKPYTFPPSHKLWLAANKRLKIADDSNATWRRTVPLDFTESFTGREDWKLEPRLRQEASGILAWVVAGAMLWYAHGLGDLPTAVAETKREYREEQDPASVFFADVLVADAAATLMLADATKVYQCWQRHNSWSPQVNNERDFAKLARKQGLTPVKSTGGRFALKGYRTRRVDEVDENYQSPLYTRI
jgi:putative DNA primase/helicase